MRFDDGRMLWLGLQGHFVLTVRALLSFIFIVADAFVSVLSFSFALASGELDVQNEYDLLSAVDWNNKFFYG